MGRQEMVALILLLAIAIVVLVVTIVVMSKQINKMIDEEVEDELTMTEISQSNYALSRDVANAYTGYRQLQSMMDDVIKQETGAIKDSKSSAKKFDDVKDLAVAVKLMADMQMDYLSVTLAHDEERNKQTSES